MAESKKTRKTSQKPKQNGRDMARDRQRQRRDYAAGADGEQDVNAGPAEASEQSKARAQADDHSEREWGGDQDIDTAGMVPGNKATDDEDPKGS